MATPTVPTADEVAARLNVQAADLAGFYDAAVEQQGSECFVQSYSFGLREALIRRVANLWVSKSHTLGVLDTGNEGFGVSYVPRYDPIIDSLELPHRRETVVVA